MRRLAVRMAFTMTLALGTGLSADITVKPEAFSGVLLVGENKFYSSLGIEAGAGFRFSDRHFAGCDIAVSRLFGGVTDVAAPANRFVTAFGLSYLFRPVNIAHRFGWEIGPRSGYNWNEYNEFDCYLGLHSRLTAGGKKTAFYASGIISAAGLIDLFGGSSHNSPYVFNASSGLLWRW